MAWRAANSDDLDWIAPFLRGHVQSSMFLLGNLADHGLGSEHANGLNLWAKADNGGVFAITNGGMILMQAPGASAADWHAAGDLVAGLPLSGCAGETTQLRAFLAASGLDARPSKLNEDEPGFALGLGDLILPETAGAELIPMAEAPRSLVLDWRAAYHAEVLGETLEGARAKVAGDIDAYLARDSHRVLMIGGHPAAMTGFNATAGAVVQVGGVYTPPALRGRGHARLAVALHLAEARAKGAARAVLFAASGAAAKAYTAIGFRPAGRFSLVLFGPPVEEHA